MLACLAFKYRYHKKNFCREVRESKGCRKAVGKTNKQTKNTQRSSTFIWYFSHTTHSVGDQGKIKYVSLLPWLWVENYSKNRPERTIYKGW